MIRRIVRCEFLAFGCFMVIGAGPLLAQSTSLCSIVHYKACYGDGECFDAPTDPADSPAFITVDRDAGVVHATEPRFSDRSSPILNSVEEDGRIMLTGVQEGRGWSITVVEETGEMSLAISDPDEAILVFGRCVAVDALDP
jgi:hypothetical protein